MPKRSPAHMEAQQERIVRAAIRCIATLGIERTSVAEIRGGPISWGGGGLRAGAIYTHFRSKEEIVAAALRFGSAGATDLPRDWPALRAWVADTGDQLGFDFATMARTQLQVAASSVRPGPMHDALKPMIEAALEGVVAQLTAMEQEGRVRLRLSPRQTALAIAALRDGMAWLALARDRPVAELEEDLVAALDCLLRSV